MILITLAALLVLGIALYQMGQGAFSSLLMATLSILCAMVALNYYEPLADYIRSLGEYKRDPTYIYGTSLVAIFLVSLLGLRILFDRVATANVSLGTWGDRIVGGALGLVTGTVLVGVMLIAIQMLPWDGAFMGFKPYDAALQRNQTFTPFKPDQFVVGMGETLSAGSLGSGKPFEASHPDLLLELFANRNRAELSGRASAQNGDLQVRGVHNFPQGKLPSWMEGLPEYPLADKTRSQATYVVRVNVSQDAADVEDRWFRLPATHFRLVTISGEGDKARYHYYYPVAFLTYMFKPSANEQNWKMISRDTGTSPKLAAVAQLVVERNTQTLGKPTIDIDWVYRIPADEKPCMMIFRNVAKVSDDSGTPTARMPAVTPFNENDKEYAEGALKRNG